MEKELYKSSHTREDRDTVMSQVPCKEENSREKCGGKQIRGKVCKGPRFLALGFLICGAFTVTGGRQEEGTDPNKTRKKGGTTYLSREKEKGKLEGNGLRLRKSG